MCKAYGTDDVAEAVAAEMRGLKKTEILENTVKELRSMEAKCKKCGNLFTYDGRKVKQTPIWCGCEPLKSFVKEPGKPAVQIACEPDPEGLKEFEKSLSPPLVREIPTALDLGLLELPVTPVPPDSFDEAENYQRPPITGPPDFRPWKQPAVKKSLTREIALKGVFRDVELRLLSRDPGRGETPYDEMEMLSFASGKLKRYRNALMKGKDGDPTEVTEALDYILLWCMRDEWGK